MGTKKKPIISLPLRMETVLRCDYNTLDQFIKKVTGKTYESWAAEEWNRNSYNRYHVSGDMETWDMVNWKEFKRTGKYTTHSLRAILNGLASEGHIQTGIYLFDTF